VVVPEEEMCSAWVRVRFMLLSAVVEGEEGREGGKAGREVRQSELFQTFAS
jgi:hypothetical protein